MILSSRHLRHILVLARLLNFSRAAAEIGITQSALSKSVHVFETEFGVRLFDRDRSGVQVTPAAGPILERAQALLAEVNDFESFVGRVARSEAGEIKFGIAPFPAYLLLAETLSQLLAEAPDILCQAVTRSSSVMAEMLMAGEIDFCIAMEGAMPFEAAIRMEPIGKIPMGLFVQADHPLLAGSEAGSRYAILQASTTNIPSDILELIGDVVSGDIHVIEDYASLVKLALTSDSLLMSSPYAIARELAEGALVEVPTDTSNPVPPVTVCFYSLVRRTNSPLASRARQLFQSRLARIAKAGP